MFLEGFSLLICFVCCLLGPKERRERQEAFERQLQDGGRCRESAATTSGFWWFFSKHRWFLAVSMNILIRSKSFQKVPLRCTAVLNLLAIKWRTWVGASFRGFHVSAVASFWGARSLWRWSLFRRKAMVHFPRQEEFGLEQVEEGFPHPALHAEGIP